MSFNIGDLCYFKSYCDIHWHIKALCIICKINNQFQVVKIIKSFHPTYKVNDIWQTITCNLEKVY